MAPVHITMVESADLSPTELAALRELWDAAFDDFTDEDAAHAFGGVHVLAWSGDALVAHASAVARTILVGETTVEAGYVEAVATAPTYQGRGLGTAVMERLQDELRERWALGVLSTGEWRFYERLGWERLRGPSYVITDAGTIRTEDEDDGLMVLRYAATAGLDLTASITCYDRPGDAW